MTTNAAPETVPDRRLGDPVPQTADPIDRVVRLAPKWTVFVLAACALLVLGIIAWSVRGTVVSSATAAGLYSERGALEVITDEAVTIDRVLVRHGQQVRKGQELLTLAGGGALGSPQDGVVSSVLVSAGSAVPADTTVVRVTDPTDPDKVVTLVPAHLRGTVVVGQSVRMEVSSAPSSKYGYLLGTVDEISSDPYTVEQVASRIGLPVQVVESLLGGEPGLLATITLSQSSRSATSYRWSIGNGPPFAITQGVPVTSHIILTEQHPLEVVFPGLDRQP
jgi:biotin carboxyl carrier protein